jgi:hypothetical protein
VHGTVAGTFTLFLIDYFLQSHSKFDLFIFFLLLFHFDCTRC